MQLITVGKSKNRIFRARMHRHTSWELIYNISGTGLMQVGEQTVPFEPGSILLCPPEIPHEKQSEGGFEDIFMRFSGYERSTQVHLLTDAYDRRLLRLLQVLHSAWYENAAPSVCGNLADAILGLIRPMLSGMEQSEYVRALRSMIADQFPDPDLSIRALMAALPVNPDHLRRQFVKELGLPPHAYLTQLRIETAKRLLSEEGCSVAQAAYHCGFYDALYFSKVFHRATGVPPSHWK